jgi:hypothetical protein
MSSKIYKLFGLSGAAESDNGKANGLEGWTDNER